MQETAVQIEECAQCGRTFRGQLPIVAIQQLDINQHHAILRVSENGLWMARSVCHGCHQAPTLKAHYQYRNGPWERALESAGSSDLGK